jgi:hypothetical protein
MHAAYRTAALTVGLAIAYGLYCPPVQAQVGACCLGQGVCVETDATDCANVGGLYGGDGSQCPTQFPVVVHLNSPSTNLYLMPAVDCDNVGARGSGCVPGPLIDAWITSPPDIGPDSCHEFGGGVPESPPLPADFFGPGSDPFEGQVCLRGEPLGPTTWGFCETADTLIIRHADPFDPCDRLLTDPVPVGSEIVQLNLVSTAPIVVTYWGGMDPELWDVTMTLSPQDPIPGQLSATKTHCNGGTYDSFLPVQPRFTFTRVDPPGGTVIYDPDQNGVPPVYLQGSGTPWVLDLDPGLSVEPDPPPCTDFHPGVEDLEPTLDCPLPNQTRETVQLFGPAMMWTLEPAVVCLDAPLPGDCDPGALIDAWQTADPGSGEPTCHTFGLGSESPAIPPDFFEPGSEPFTGAVCLAGEPLGPTPFGQYEDADTLILRNADPFDRCEIPDPNERLVDIEIVALNLHSIEPITVFVFGAPTLWDVAVDLSTVPPPAGTLGATKTHCNGGTYNSELFVQPRFTFTKVAGPGEPVGSSRQLDTGLEGIQPIQLGTLDDPPWVSDIHPLFGPDSPWCTDFHPGLDDPAAPTDCDCNLNTVRDVCDIESGTSTDCNANIVPDECESVSGGDYDNDGDVDPDDFTSFEQCLGGPGVLPGGLPECLGLCLDAFDEDTDGDVDLQDFGGFTQHFAGP